MRYRAFISYSHADARWAAWLHRSLESYRLPSRLRGGHGEHGPLPDRLSPIFRDREDLSSAGHLGPLIDKRCSNPKRWWWCARRMRRAPRGWNRKSSPSSGPRAATACMPSSSTASPTPVASANVSRVRCASDSSQQARERDSAETPQAGDEAQTTPVIINR